MLVHLKYYTINQINRISKKWNPPAFKRPSLTQTGRGVAQFPAEGFDPKVQQHKCDKKKTKAGRKQAKETMWRVRYSARRSSLC